MNYIEETMMDASVDQPAEPTSRSRCTRSHLQEAAVWTVQDMLILVNEVAAVEGECQNALSTHQKWTIVAETCTALGVVRNANQCRRKWQSLLADYHLVKEWTSSSATDSYWSLGSESRIQAGLPSDFDKDLYKAIEDFTKAPDRTDTDPECDPEAADVDMLNAEEPAVLGPKPRKRRRRSVPHKRLIAEWKRPVLESENVKPEDLILEGMDQILAAKLVENAELINAILAENDDEDINEDFTYLRDDEGFKIEKARRKADKLVACLGDLAKNLEHLCGLVEKG